MTFSDQIAIRTLWQEARGESNQGQRAVAHVLLNRLKNGHWGPTLAHVCLSHAQFSGWLTTDPNWKPSIALSDFDPKLLELNGALTAARQEPDFTEGAMHYHAASMPKKPVWTLGATLVGQFGSQLFYKEVN